MMQLMDQKYTSVDSLDPRCFRGVARIVERVIMNTNERMIRFVFISGFLAVLLIEAWLLLRAFEVFL